MQASQFVQVIEERQGLKIGAIEQAAYQSGFITREELHKLAKPFKEWLRETLTRPLMNVTKTGLKDCFLIEPQIFGDDRGYFFESFNQKLFAKNRS